MDELMKIREAYQHLYTQQPGIPAIQESRMLADKEKACLRKMLEANKSRVKRTREIMKLNKLIGKLEQEITRQKYHL